MIRELQNTILRQADKLLYRVSDIAPSDINSVLQQGKELCIWSGASDATIWQCPKVNYAFRALHDALHVSTGIGFTPSEEIELGRMQASQYDGILADIVYIEVAGQAMHYLNTGNFVSDQVKFTLDALKQIGYTNIK